MEMDLPTALKDFSIKQKQRNIQKAKKLVKSIDSLCAPWEVVEHSIRNSAEDIPV